MNLGGQAWALGIMIAVGLGLGGLLDLRRACIRVFHLRGFAIALADVLYWCLATGSIFAALIVACMGEIRFAFLIALAIGFCWYGWMFQPLFLRGWIHVVRWLSYFGYALWYMAKILLLCNFIVLQTTVHFLWLPLIYLREGFRRGARPLWRWLCNRFRVPAKEETDGEEEPRKE